MEKLVSSYFIKELFGMNKEKDTEKKRSNLEREPEALEDDELEEIVGGLTSVMVPICTNCKKRVAVYQMTLCAVCYLKLK